MLLLHEDEDDSLLELEKELLEESGEELLLLESGEELLLEESHIGLLELEEESGEELLELDVCSSGVYPTATTEILNEQMEALALGLSMLMF